MKTTILLLIISSFVNDVLANNFVSVIEGDSVTLHTDITEIQSQDVIEWRFGDQQDLIAKINREAQKELLDGRFREKFKMNNQTGDLTITNFTTQQTGVYEVEIIRHEVTTKKFNISGVVGVGGLNSVSVMEGDSVTLFTDVSNIKMYDVIMWKYQHKTSIAELNRNTADISTDKDERFKDKLQLDIKSGSLTIKSINKDHSGLYEVDIKNSNHTIHQSFTLTVSDGVKSVSGKEGESVIIYTNISKIQKDDLIQWMFGSKETLIAQINKNTNETSTYPGVLDGRFRDKLELNDQTGDLIIKNINSDDARLYQLKMNNRRRSIERKFDVIVGGHGLSINAVIGICFGVGVFALVVFGLILYHHMFLTAQRPEVKEGDSVILHTDLTNLNVDDKIEWKFGHHVIAKINGPNNQIYPDVLGGQFERRLNRKPRTGSLIISDTKVEDAGLYKLKINGRRKPPFKKFKLTVKETHQRILANEGNVCNLKTDLTDIQNIETMTLSFDDEDILTYEIGHPPNISDRFRDILEMNHQADSVVLTINNFQMYHLGDYTLKIICEETTSYRRFTVTVRDSETNQPLLNGNNQDSSSV